MSAPSLEFQSSLHALIESWKTSPHPSIKVNTYFPVYVELFNHLRNTACVFIETGTLGGGSLFMWRKWLGEKARIIGIDLNPEAEQWREYGFEIFIGDQGDPVFWQKTLAEIGQFDVLLDDGGHQSFQQVVTVVEAIKHLTQRGMVVVEDTHTNFMRDFAVHGKNTFLNYAKDATDVLTARASTLYSDRFIENVENDDIVNLFKNVFSIQFYMSIVAFKIEPDLLISPESIVNKNKSSISDFRYQGKSEAATLWPNPFSKKTVTIHGGKS